MDILLISWCTCHNCMSWCTFWCFDIPFDVRTQFLTSWHYFVYMFWRHQERYLTWVPFLAPPAERQWSFSNTDLSVVRLSVRPSRLRGGGGGGVYLKNASVTFLIFCMKLLLGDINHISKDRFGWIAKKVIFQGQIWLFLHLEVICSKTVQ